MKAALFVLLAASVLGVCRAQAAPYPVTTPFGPVVGALLDRTIEYRGIPFAEPPVGERRFQFSELISPWTETLDAREHRPGCLQRFGTAPQDPREVSEDCLYLNIFAPVSSGLLPVMVWFHGGNYQSGAGSSPLYDGTFMANQTNTIVVGVNYRLNFLGWGRLDTAGIPGNMGLHDKILALQFVQQTISAFGGDPNRVTVFGQSAGGTSIGALLTTEHASGLFSQALLQSNPFGLGIHTVESSARVARRFVGYTSCSSVDDADLQDCLLALDGEEILQAVSDVDNFIDISDFLQNFYPWTPVVDGDLVLDQPISAYKNGQIMDVPMMTGHTSEEGVLYAYGFLGEAIGQEDYAILAQVLFPGLPFLELYPPSSCPIVDGIEDCRPLISGAITDYVWICPTRSAAQGALERNFTSPFWQYRFDHAFSFEQGWGPGQAYCRGFVCHGGELPFSFNDCFVPDRFPEFLCTDEESKLGDEMGRAWGQFAHNANPNGIGNIPLWSQFTLPVDNYMTFATPASYPLSNLRTQFCDVLDTYGYHPETRPDSEKYYVEKLVPREGFMESIRSLYRK